MPPSGRRGRAFLLYQRDLMDGPFDDLYVAYERDNGEPVDATSRGARPRARGATASGSTASIDAAAESWTSERMAVLERNILRLAVWELREGEVPAAVAIDEAVALAKRYASPEAGSLVNGILGRIARERGGGNVSDDAPTGLADRPRSSGCGSGWRPASSTPTPPPRCSSRSRRWPSEALDRDRAARGGARDTEPST